MGISVLQIVNLANELYKRYGTRDPRQLADSMQIHILPCHFKYQKGAYKIVLNNRFIFIKDDLTPVLENIVLLHEIGHDLLHKKVALQNGGFKEFNIFDMRENRLEFEANIFTSQISIPDEAILEYIEKGYDTQQIACALQSDVNLVAIKMNTLIYQGFLNNQYFLDDYLPKI